MSGHVHEASQSSLPIRRRPSAKRWNSSWLIRPYERWQRRKSVEQLESLDDRLLADIGLLRSEIPQIVDALNSGQMRGPAPAAIARRSGMRPLPERSTPQPESRGRRRG